MRFTKPSLLVGLLLSAPHVRAHGDDAQTSSASSLSTLYVTVTQMVATETMVMPEKSSASSISTPLHSSPTIASSKIQEPLIRTIVISTSTFHTTLELAPSVPMPILTVKSTSTVKVTMAARSLTPEPSLEGSDGSYGSSTAAPHAPLITSRPWYQYFKRRSDRFTCSDNPKSMCMSISRSGRVIPVGDAPSQSAAQAAMSTLVVHHLSSAPTPTLTSSLPTPSVSQGATGYAALTNTISTSPGQQPGSACRLSSSRAALQAAPTSFPYLDNNAMLCVSYGPGNSISTLGPRPSIFLCPGMTSRSCSLMLPNNHTMVVGEPNHIYTEASVTSLDSAPGNYNPGYEPVTPIFARSFLIARPPNDYGVSVTDFVHVTMTIYVSEGEGTTKAPSTPSTISQCSAPSTSTTPAPPVLTPSPYPKSLLCLSNTFLHCLAVDGKTYTDFLVPSASSTTQTASSQPRFTVVQYGSDTGVSCIAYNGQTLTIAAPNTSVVMQTVLTTETLVTTKTFQNWLPQTTVSGTTVAPTHTFSSNLSTPTSAMLSSSFAESKSVSSIHSSTTVLALTSSSSGNAATKAPASTSQSTISAMPTAPKSASSRGMPIPKWLLLFCFVSMVFAASPTPSSLAPNPPATNPVANLPVSKGSKSSPPTTISSPPKASSSVAKASTIINSEADARANDGVWAMLLEAAHVTATKQHSNTKSKTAVTITTASLKASKSSVSPRITSKPSSANSLPITKPSSSSVAKRDPPLRFSVSSEQPLPSPCPDRSSWQCVVFDGKSTYSYDPATLGPAPVLPTPPPAPTVPVVPSATKASASVRILQVPILFAILCIAGSVFAFAEPLQGPSITITPTPIPYNNPGTKILNSHTQRPIVHEWGHSEKVKLPHELAREKKLRWRARLYWTQMAIINIVVLAFWGCVVATIVISFREPRTDNTSHPCRGNASLRHRDLPTEFPGGALPTGNTSQSLSLTSFKVPKWLLALCLVCSVSAVSKLPWDVSSVTHPWVNDIDPADVKDTKFVHKWADIPPEGVGSLSSEPVVDRVDLPPPYVFDVQVKKVKARAWYKDNKRRNKIIVTGLLVMAVGFAGWYFGSKGDAPENSTTVPIIASSPEVPKITTIITSPINTVATITQTAHQSLVTSDSSHSIPVVTVTQTWTQLVEQEPTTTESKSELTISTEAPTTAAMPFIPAVRVSKVTTVGTTSLPAKQSFSDISFTHQTPSASEIRAPNPDANKTGGMVVTPTGVSDPQKEGGGEATNKPSRGTPADPIKHHNRAASEIEEKKERIGRTEFQQFSPSIRNFNIPFLARLLLPRTLFTLAQRIPDFPLSTMSQEIVYETSFKIVTVQVVNATSTQTITSSLRPPLETVSESLGYALGYGIQRPLILLNLCLLVCVILPLWIFNHERTKWQRRIAQRRDRLSEQHGLVEKRKKERQSESSCGEKTEEELPMPVSVVEKKSEAKLRKKGEKGEIETDEEEWVFVDGNRGSLAYLG